MQPHFLTPFAFTADTKPVCQGVQTYAESPRIPVVSDNADSVAFAPTDELLHRFWSHVRLAGPNDCWIWTGNTVGHGRKNTPHLSFHGQFTIPTPGERKRQRHVYAHRFSWELVHGPIPAGLCICHSCDCPPCVNPSHLFLGTQGDNLRDAARKHRFTVPRTRTLSLSDRLAIYRTPWSPGIGVALARQYGVTEAAISIIRRGRFIGSGLWFGALAAVVLLMLLASACTQARFSAVSPSKACPDDARIVREDGVEYCVWVDKKTGREVRWRKPF